MLSAYLIKPEKLHLTLFPLKLNTEESIKAATELFIQSTPQIRSIFPAGFSPILHLNGLSHFNGRVIFASLATNQHTKKLEHLASE
jgi:hypothetical protein